MKRKFFTGIAGAALIMSSFTFTYCQTNKTQNEFLKQLGITEKDVKSNISYSFFNPSTPDWRPFQKIAAGNRAAIVTSAGNYTKQYVMTPAFEKEYKQYRDGQIKANTPPPALTKEQIAKKNITHLETDINNTENNCKKATDPNTKKACDQSLDYMKKQLVEFKSGKSAQIDYELRIDEQRYQEAKKSFDEWLKDHPESIHDLIKLRLNEFLVLTKGIDYNAVYVEAPYTGGETGGEGHFKNPVYNKKSSQWKQGFWAGKEVTETARTFVQQWLKEL
jgi:hypothetical protein